MSWGLNNSLRKVGELASHPLREESHGWGRSTCRNRSLERLRGSKAASETGQTAVKTGGDEAWAPGAGPCGTWEAREGRGASFRGEVPGSRTRALGPQEPFTVLPPFSQQPVLTLSSTACCLWPSLMVTSARHSFLGLFLLIWKIVSQKTRLLIVLFLALSFYEPRSLVSK